MIEKLEKLPEDDLLFNIVEKMNEITEAVNELKNNECFCSGCEQWRINSQQD